ncbi:ABC transporter substrate-binding protein [Cellvibrio sp. NN19]|uniref:ABC transporter substrate-binding protein n=1 Tax=Cellvibrio chitinivorans TaxID=3102792 RepID=UPI002B40F6A2|nr:ABC transporter substrate-binding protein [Cellvibrio sp. NN19]
MKFSTRFFTLLSLFSCCFYAHTSYALDKVAFQLDWLPGGDKAPVYVGVERGFFAAEGLEVNIAQGRGSNDAISKLATGNGDVGLSDLVALLLAKAGQTVPVSAIYSQFSKAPYAFYVLDSSPVKTVADVAGKKIATSAFTSANIFLPLLLSTNGVDQNSIQLIKADPGALNPMLIMGRTDVEISWITDSVRNIQQAKKAGKNLRIIPWHDAGLEFYSTSVIASDKFLNERPDVARRFLRAYAKAVAYTWEHPLESAQAVHKMVPEVDATEAEATINSIRDLVVNEVSARDGLGVFEPTRLATTWEWTAKGQQLAVDSFNPETAIKRDFLAAPRSEIATAEASAQ